MAAKAPRMLDGARGIAAPPKANERTGIAEDDAAVSGESKVVLALEPRNAFTLDALVEGYDGSKPGEYEWGAPAGKEMW